jgi:spoIIIJ-associated protein
MDRPLRDRDRGPRGRGGNRGGDRGDNRSFGGGGGGNRGGRGGRGPRREEALQPGDFEQQFAVEIPEQGTESEGAAAVRTWCEQVLSLATLSATIRTEENDEQIHVRLYGGDAKRFTEEHGELLDALQVLANKALVGRRVEKDIELDCEAFKQRRTTDLEERARELADRVRADGREQLLPAMSPIERRIVHLALQDDADVTTDSRGDGFYKRVAIIPRPAAGES